MIRLNSTISLKIFLQNINAYINLELLNKYSDSSSIFPYVPAEIVLEVIMKHGGMISGEIPNLDLSDIGKKNE